MPKNIFTAVLVISAALCVPDPAFANTKAEVCVTYLQHPISAGRMLPDVPKGTFSAVSLKNSYFRLSASPVFASAMSAHWLMKKLRYANIFGVSPLYSLLAEDPLLSDPRSIQESHQIYADRRKQAENFLGTDNFLKLQQYANEVKEMLQENLQGTLISFAIEVRCLSIPAFRLRLSPEGFAQGGHRHLYPAANFVEVTVLKSERGATTIGRDGQGRPFNVNNDDLLIFTDAWHAAPNTDDDRLLIVIDARFSSDLYRGYYGYNEYNTDNK